MVRSQRQRGAVSYCEYDDDTFDSPKKKSMKKRVIDSDSDGDKENRAGTLLQFAKSRVDNVSRNTRDDLSPKRDKKRLQTVRSRKRTEKVSVIIDSDLEDNMEEDDVIVVEEDPDSKPAQQTRRSNSSKARTYKEVPSSDEEEDEPGQEEEDEEEALFDSSSEDDDAADLSDFSDSDNEEACITSSHKSAASSQKNKKPTLSASNTGRALGTRRSARATAKPRFSYANMQRSKTYQSDDEEEEDDEVDEEQSDEDMECLDPANNDNSNQGDWNIEDDDDVLANIEKVLSLRKESDGSRSFRVKLKGKSYRQTKWLPRDALWASPQRGVQALVRNFEKKAQQGEVDPYGDLHDGVHAEWLIVDRIVAHLGFTIDASGDSDIEIVDSEDKTASIARDHSKRFLVKWRGLSYCESTWEDESTLDQTDDHVAIRQYVKHTADAVLRKRSGASKQQVKEQQGIDIAALPDFCNGRCLRDYQKDSLRWMSTHWYNGQNCILGDEMGLGKTAQSISVLAFQQQFGGTEGPFLVIAPLTTLGHWQREIQTWTSMNCIVYSGSAADRSVIQKYELWVHDDVEKRGGSRGTRVVKPHVVLSSYEMVLRDQLLFQGITWETIIIDEAHRMKGTSSSTRTAIASIPTYWLLLLTGTPVQNNMRELYGLLNLLDPGVYSNEQSFLDLYGDDRTGVKPEQVRALQAVLRPILLRRMKEDVETLPEKEECIIWVQLTADQRIYYKSIFEGQIGTLLAGSSTKNLPNLRNLAMELRKVCCHPYLCNGLEEDAMQRRQAAGMGVDQLSALVQASGKMLLLHKLLPKLRAEGHKVLIFSQFKIMLDVLEDYLTLAGHSFERIDGSTSGRDRQAAIDRFSKEGSDGFVFLLSTRAGGQGITLTAADTCIIYDSDWNPQNDLQAMARCHRIGQEKEVTIYRLVSKDTYEEHVFKTSSRKYGLDEAILGYSHGSKAKDGGNPETDGKKIAELLKHGAHCLAAMDAVQKETDAFASEDIDQILQGRTEKRQIGGRAGNTFSMATFDAQGSGSLDGSLTAEGSGEGAAFWTALLPEAVAAHEEKMKAAAMPVILPPRQRKRINYSEQFKLGRRRHGEDSGDECCGDGSESDGEGGKKRGNANNDAKAGDGAGAVDGEATTKKKKNIAGSTAEGLRLWTRTDVEAFFERILRVGFKRSSQAAKELELVEKKRYAAEDVTSVADLLSKMLEKALEVAPQPVKRRRFVPESAAKGADVQPNNATMASGGGGGHTDASERGDDGHSLSTEHSIVVSLAIDGEENASDHQLAASAASLKRNESTNSSALEKKMYEESTAQYDKDVAAKVPLLVTLAAERAPETARRALADGKLADRLLRSCHRYRAHLDDVDLLAKIAEEKHQFLPLRSVRGLPMWFSREDVAALCKGCYSLGLECTSVTRKSLSDIETVLTDDRFGFTKKVVLQKSDCMATCVKGAQKTADGGNGGGGVGGMKNDGREIAESMRAPTDSTVVNTDQQHGQRGAQVQQMSQEEWSKFKDALLKLLRATLKYLHESGKRVVARPWLPSTGAAAALTAPVDKQIGDEAAQRHAKPQGQPLLLKQAVHNHAKSLGQLPSTQPSTKPLGTSSHPGSSTGNVESSGSGVATIARDRPDDVLGQHHRVNGATMDAAAGSSDQECHIVIDNDGDDDDPIETSSMEEENVVVAAAPAAIIAATRHDNNDYDDDEIVITSSPLPSADERSVKVAAITPAIPKTAEIGGAPAALNPKPSTVVAPHPGENNATPMDGRMSTVASINVFEETRGGFTDPLTGGGAALKRKKDACSVDGEAAKMMNESSFEIGDGGGEIVAVAGGMRQRSLFELKKVKVLKRTVNGIEEESVVL